MCVALSDKGTVLQGSPPVVSDKIPFLQRKVPCRFPRVNAQDFKTALHFFVKESLHSIPYGEVSSQQLFPGRQLLWETFELFSSTLFQNSKTRTAYSLKLMLIAVRNQITLLHRKVCYPLVQ